MSASLVTDARASSTIVCRKLDEVRMHHQIKWSRCILISFASLVLVSCGARHDADEKYYLVSANIQVPYWKSAGEGFIQAASQTKVRAEFVGPDTYDPKAEQTEFE